MKKIPKEQIPFPEISDIYYEDCPASDSHWYEIPWFGGAHTHMCPYDPLSRAICFSAKAYAFKPDGSPTEMLMHEYAHVLDAIRNWTKFDKIECPTTTTQYHAFTSISTKFLNFTLDELHAGGHTRSWVKIMQELGQPINYAYRTDGSADPYSVINIKKSLGRFLQF